MPLEWKLRKCADAPGCPWEETFSKASSKLLWLLHKWKQLFQSEIPIVNALCSTVTLPHSSPWTNHNHTMLGTTISTCEEVSWKELSNDKRAGAALAFGNPMQNATDESAQAWLKCEQDWICCLPKQWKKALLLWLLEHCGTQWHHTPSQKCLQNVQDSWTQTHCHKKDRQDYDADAHHLQFATKCLNSFCLCFPASNLLPSAKNWPHCIPWKASRTPMWDCLVLCQSVQFVSKNELLLWLVKATAKPRMMPTSVHQSGTHFNHTKWTWIHETVLLLVQRMDFRCELWQAKMWKAHSGQHFSMDQSSMQWFHNVNLSKVDHST